MSQLLTLPARTGTAMRLASGAVLKIVNTHGTQVVDCWAFDASDLCETMSMPHSRNNFWHLSPSPGDCFVTNLRRPILTLVDRIQHMVPLRRRPKPARKGDRCAVMLEHHKHRATHPAGLGRRPSGPQSRLLGASSALDDAKASPPGALLPRSRDWGS